MTIALMVVALNVTRTGGVLVQKDKHSGLFCRSMKVTEKKVYNLIESFSVDVRQEVDVHSVEQAVDGDVISLATLREMAGEAEDDFTADWLRSKDAAEKSNVGLEKVLAVYFQLQPDGSEL